MILKDLATIIINQHCQHTSNVNATNIKNKIKQINLQNRLDELTKLQNNFNDNQRRNQEQGASSWLTTLQIPDEGYDLTEQLFWDLIGIRYG